MNEFIVIAMSIFQVYAVDGSILVTSGTSGAADYSGDTLIPANAWGKYYVVPYIGTAATVNTIRLFGKCSFSLCKVLLF